MLDLNAYCVFRRLELLELVSNVTETTTNNKDYMKIYGRDQWGQKDKLIQYKFDHIKHLEVQRINY